MMYPKRDARLASSYASSAYGAASSSTQDEPMPDATEEALDDET